MNLEDTDLRRRRSNMKKICEIDFTKAIRKKYPFTLVIFGGRGDLSLRKLIPSLFHLYSLNQLDENFNIISYGMPEMTGEEYRTLIRESLERHYKRVDRGDLDAFIERFYYVSGGFDEGEKYKKILELHNGFNKTPCQIIYYLAIPPKFAGTVIENLAQDEFRRSVCSKKIIMEKPFGVDRPSAEDLNQIVLKVFDEGEIYRIDHYLGKETVQNILFFRFGNSMFEPLWNRNFIDHIQITAAESIGIEHRGKFYEGAGVVRDIVQNHVLQLLALVAMEPPADFHADMIRDEKLKIFKSIREMDSEYLKRNMMKGQYGRGSEISAYREEKDVETDSQVPTFMAGKFFVDNWRWAGVPFYIRAGKRLKEKVTEIYIQFKQPPLKLFGDECNDIVPNGLLISIQPEERISIRINSKYPGSENYPHPVELDFNYKQLGKYDNLDAYERLILDCLRGDLTLFARQDGIEAMWEVVDPVNKYFEEWDDTLLPNYKGGSWGPEKAQELLKLDGRCWRITDECILMEEV